jgi:GTP-binding protein
MTTTQKITQEKIRNVAIIAHVDHGKTTLVDAFIKQSKLFRDNQEEMQQTQILDSNDLEREKGITILAKNIAIQYMGYKINIIDTPGHADFGGEVERTLNMADGCILVVDAQEGTMPQTEFVLKKALELKLKPIVLINKIDKKFADVKRVVNEVSDLFLSLVTEDSQLDFPLFYAIGREGKVFTEMPKGDLTIPNLTTGDLRILLDKIIEYIPSPVGEGNEPFQMLISSLDFDPHIGRHLIGKVHRGTLKLGDAMQIATLDEDGNVVKKESGRVKQRVYSMLKQMRV